MDQPAVNFDPQDHLDLDRLAGDIATAKSPVVPVREHLAQVQQAMAEAFRAGTDVRSLVFGRSRIMDAILHLLWNQSPLSEAQNLSLIAVGGYGRGELHPYSDIDLLILTGEDNADSWQDALSNFLTLLWDLGLDIGHSVRSIEECVSAAREDATILTNLLETRHIAGNTTLPETLRERAYSTETLSDRDYFAAKRREQQARHRKYGATEYNLEPNIKGAPGALRDIQTIMWIARRHFGLADPSDLVRFSILSDEEFTLLREGETFLWQLRYGLQLLAGRNENRLLFDYQLDLARMLGFEDKDDQLGVELMMQAYYRCVLGLAELADAILQHLDEVILRAEDPEDIRPLNRRFQIRNNYLEATNTQVFAYAPYSLLEIFVLLAQHPEVEGIRAPTIRAIRAHRHLIDDAFRQNLACNSLFMELLRTPHELDTTLSYMKRYNVLGRYLPEFGRIIGQMQHDLFHVYTVDAHTIRVISNMVLMQTEEGRDQFPLASRLVHQLPKLELLYVAGLFHDVAKGRGGDHSELGAIDATRFCEQHYLSDRDTKLVAWLIENHLLMSLTAQKCDISDPAIIREFARKIPSRVHLVYLYILTVCDIAATNPTLWNTWRDSLLRQLYIETRRVLRRGIDSPFDRNDWIRATCEEARDMLRAQGYSNESIDEVWNTLDDDFFLQDATIDIVWQTAAIIRHGSDPKPLVMIRDTTGGPTDGYTHIIIYVRDRRALFAATTAVLEQVHLNIVDARILSGEGAHNLSSYIVVDEQGQPLGKDPERRDHIQHRLVEELSHPDDYPAIIERRVPRKLKHFAFPTEVTISTDTANQRTILEVVTPDRPGLLARIGRILLEQHIRLVSAKIATLGERVEDIFFVTDEQGNPLEDPQLCETVRNSLCQQLDEVTGLNGHQESDASA
ncbi:UTP--GlnB (protein PII) uridylyltransferase GlnD [Halospina denitrificans]|uniref:Bifunctional uridylyltransferase/uridylyl-removing enzyme n=1 Tax=Halospina denitrificans TaxID=332522 RepID=A0A4R7JXJ1_9GAMM|nr:[protein-PII] uridylyltransferase [Halospina denitrificans]TDT43200.1 UTP--GlnB (protein PII) uridylyltransferase GlnD [Halospina denitrificans]